MDQAETSALLAANLVPLDAQVVPRSATFWVLQDVPATEGSRATTANRLLAPYPCVPPGGGVFYTASQYRPNVFLVDQRTNPEVDADLLSALVRLRIQIAAANATTTESISEMSLLSEGPPLPGEGGSGTNSGGGTYEYSSPVYGSNDLWIVIGWTNSGSVSLLNITIHPPTSDTNGTPYDVFGTTNLTSSGYLNVTNWAWLFRTSGETNIVVTNTWPDIGFYRLGTMLDSDDDGLTDAYELLTSHTDRFDQDTDHDGITDYWEVALGLNPRGDDTAQPGSRCNYFYTLADWLNSVSGTRSGSVSTDAEGNVLTVSQ